MGAASSLLPWGKKHFVVVMVGLNGSGKTTIVNRLKDRRGLLLTPPVETIGEEGLLKALESQSDDLHLNQIQNKTKKHLTAGFNFDTVIFPFASIEIWDFGGKEKIRPMWRSYYHQGDAFIFVVSALESGRLLEARKELHYMCKDRDIWKCPLLVLVNKSEKLDNNFPNPNAAPPEFVSAALDIATSGFRTWTIRAVSAMTGEGLDDAFRWLSDRVHTTTRRLQKVQERY